MIRLTFQSVPRELNQAKLRLSARTTYKTLGLRVNGVIAVAFVNKAQSQKLNTKFATQPKPTDVLSFSYLEPTKATLPTTQLGDIAICLPIAKKAAKSYKHSLQSEVTLLLVHGVMHILGLDHQTGVAKTSFETIQNAIMKELQISSRPYLHDHT